MLRPTASRSDSKENQRQSPAKYVTKLEQEFDVGESLGEGGYGQIFKAKRKSDNNQFAIKIIEFDPDFEDVGTIRREANLLSELNHGNIVRYYNSWVETAHIPHSVYDTFQIGSDNCLLLTIRTLSLNSCFVNDVDDKNEMLDFDDFEQYETDEEEEDGDEASDTASDDDSYVAFQSEYREIKYLFIQMELCEKRTLRSAIDENLYLDENRIAKYFKEICEGLSYIHNKNIVHRDFNPKNIFLTANDVIKIGDFGVSKQIETELESMQNHELPYGSLTATCGTTVYIAPELFNGDKCNIKADIYSLGVTYFEMCSKPMTDSEKIRIFPINWEKWKNIHFVTNTSNKRTLLKSLLHKNHRERPTCDDILKILNSDTSFDAIRNVIPQNRKVSQEEWKGFERALKSTNFGKEKLSSTFLTTAQKIFELHGGKSLAMPTFLPSFSHHSDHLTTLLSKNRTFSSVSNTSRIAFCYYIANKKINKIRRYSIGKVFEDGFHSPTEIQECIFEAVSPEIDDHVADAEMLYIGEKICDEIFSKDKEIFFIINHGHIFWNILKHCQIARREASLFMHSCVTPEMLSGLELRAEILSFLWRMETIYSSNINQAQILITEAIKNNNNGIFCKININIINKAFSELTVIIENARKFGLRSNIIFSPLLINQAHSTGFMFQMLHLDRKILAMGGRFHSLIKTCRRTKNRHRLNVSAVDISFNVDNVLKLLTPLPKTRNVDVVIVAKDKPVAIPLYKYLLSKQIRCEIVKEFVCNSDSNLAPFVLIQLSGEYSYILYQIQETERSVTSPWKLREICRGNWMEGDTFSRLLSIVLSKQSSSSVRSLPSILPNILRQVLNAL